MAVHNVRDFGAWGDNIHDDTAAVQAALDAARDAGGGVVLVPQGTYRLTDTLTVYPRLSIQGEGDQVSVLYQANPQASGLHGVDVTFFDVRDLQLKGPGTDSPGGAGIFLSREDNPNSEGITLENVFIWQFGDSGVAISVPIVSTFARVIAQQNGASGFALYGGGTSCALTGCYASGNGQAGYHLGLVYSHFSGCAADSNGVGYYAGPGCRNLTFSACGAEATVSKSSTYNGTAWKIDGAGDIVLAGCYAAATGNRSFHVTGSAQSATLISCTEAHPAAEATASFQVDAGCSATIVGWTYETPPDLAPRTTTIANDGAGNLTVPGTLQVGGTGMARTTGILTAAFTVSGTTAETTVASLTVPAGEPAAGTFYHLVAFGIYTSVANSPTLTPAARWGGPGGTALTRSIATPALTAGTNRPWRIEGWVNFVSPTSCYARLHFAYGTGTGAAILEIPVFDVVTGLDTGVDTALGLTLTWSKTGANVFTVQGASLQRWA